MASVWRGNICGIGEGKRIVSLDPGRSTSIIPRRAWPKGAEHGNSRLDCGWFNCWLAGWSGYEGWWLRHGRGHHSWTPRWGPGRLDFREARSVNRWRHDRLNHRRVYWRRDFGRDYTFVEKILTGAISLFHSKPVSVVPLVDSTSRKR